MTPETNSEDDPPSWASLFERGAAYAVTLQEIDTTLAARRDTEREESP